MRSGSTLQYQITARLVEESRQGRRLGWIDPQEFPHIREQLRDDKTWKVLKTHDCTDSIIEEFERGNAIGIYIYRDIRDAFTSQMTKAATKSCILLRQGFIKNCIENYDKWTQLPGVLISQYEAVVEDIVGEVSRIAQHLDIAMESSQLYQIADDLVMEKQKARLENLQIFEQIEHLRLDRHIQGADGLVTDNQLWAHC